MFTAAGGMDHSPAFNGMLLPAVRVSVSLLASTKHKYTNLCGYGPPNATADLDAASAPNCAMASVRTHHGCTVVLCVKHHLYNRNNSRRIWSLRGARCDLSNQNSTALSTEHATVLPMCSRRHTH